MLCGGLWGGGRVDWRGGEGILCGLFCGVEVVWREPRLTSAGLRLGDEGVCILTGCCNFCSVLPNVSCTPSLSISARLQRPTAALLLCFEIGPIQAPWCLPPCQPWSRSFAAGRTYMLSLTRPRLHGPPTNQPINQPMNQPSDRLTNQSINQPSNQSFQRFAACQSIRPPCNPCQDVDVAGRGHRSQANPSPKRSLDEARPPTKAKANRTHDHRDHHSHHERDHNGDHNRDHHRDKARHSRRTSPHGAHKPHSDDRSPTATRT